ncbi:TetR family transcriptional regulator C-terminal domain-containing protein [Streptomyces sp. NPDC051243]|uniref:TetR family transcriptional regulator C-terminal domain-containing protein n=1 Tax=Streptomyces sp. NPDC051243 TaxID=3365646 RepID=UPI0037A69B9D
MHSVAYSRTGAQCRASSSVTRGETLAGRGPGRSGWEGRPSTSTSTRPPRRPSAGTGCTETRSVSPWPTCIVRFRSIRAPVATSPSATRGDLAPVGDCAEAPAGGLHPQTDTVPLHVARGTSHGEGPARFYPPHGAHGRVDGLSQPSPGPPSRPGSDGPCREDRGRANSSLASWTARRDRYAGLRGLFAEALAEACELGETRADLNLEDAAGAVIAVMDGLQAQWLFAPESVDMSAATDRVITALLADITGKHT